MSYIDNNLLANEVIVFKGSIHWIIFLPPLIYFGFAGFIYGYFGLPAVGFILACFATVRLCSDLIYYFTTELAVTNERVMAKFGLIRRRTFELNLARVTSLNVDQSVLGRILNYGNVYVNGMGGMNTPIPVIRDPMHFRHQVLGEVEKRETTRI